MKIVVIGSSAAAKSAVENIRRHQSSHHQITVITRDRIPFYSRVMLPNYLAEHLKEEDLSCVQPYFIEENDLEMICGTAVKLDTKDKKVLLSNGDHCSYDRLLICTGASPNRLQNETNLPEGVFQFRDLEDAQRIQSTVEQISDCIVAGGGLIGLKAAWALNKLGLKVTVLHRSPQLLSTFMDEKGSRMAQTLLEQQGINVVLNDTIKDYITEHHRMAGIMLNSGQMLKGQMVVWAAGVKPNLDLVRDSGIQTGDGILVDDTLATTASDIYAAGDVTQAKNLLTQEADSITLWTDATLQGKVAAYNLLGIRKLYQGGLTMNSVVFNGVPFISMGTIRDCDTRYCTVYEKQYSGKGVYRKVVVENGSLIGAVFVGDVRYAGMVNWDIRARRLADAPEKYLSIGGLESIYREHASEVSEMPSQWKKP